MAEITTEQMAQLLVGVARAQLAIVDAVENLKPGFRTTHLRPLLESASRIRSNHPLAMADFPSRLLLQMLGRNPPQAGQVALELERLLEGGNNIPGRDPQAGP